MALCQANIHWYPTLCLQCTFCLSHPVWPSRGVSKQRRSTWLHWTTFVSSERNSETEDIDLDHSKRAAEGRKQTNTPLILGRRHNVMKQLKEQSTPSKRGELRRDQDVANVERRRLSNFQNIPLVKSLLVRNQERRYLSPLNMKGVVYVDVKAL